MNNSRSDRPVTAKAASDRMSAELSSRRTGMSFQRTRMSADRTLMSVIRTSLSLIGFGFTIAQVFQRLHEAQILKRAQAPHNFGLALVFLGVAMLILGIVYHTRFMLELRRQREEMGMRGLLHAESRFPVSATLIIAAVLLAVGLFVIVSMRFDVGPFGLSAPQRCCGDRACCRSRVYSPRWSSA